MLMTEYADYIDSFDNECAYTDSLLEASMKAIKTLENSFVSVFDDEPSEYVIKNFINAAVDEE